MSINYSAKSLALALSKQANCPFFKISDLKINLQEVYSQMLYAAVPTAAFNARTACPASTPDTTIAALNEQICHAFDTIATALAAAGVQPTDNQVISLTAYLDQDNRSLLELYLTTGFASVHQMSIDSTLLMSGLPITGCLHLAQEVGIVIDETSARKHIYIGLNVHVDAVTFTTGESPDMWTKMERALDSQTRKALYLGTRVRTYKFSSCKVYGVAAPEDHIEGEVDALSSPVSTDTTVLNFMDIDA